MTPISCRCKRPYMVGDLPFGCGQCMPCRIKKRREWVHRLTLEQRLHGDASFLTLTYDPKLKNPHHKNPIHPEGHLVPEHLTNFIKRLRRNFTSNSIRYFAVGEYGERSGHPHYHAIIFGFPTCTGDRCTDSRGYKCQACQIAHDAWSAGYIYNGDVTRDSLSYVAGYVTKGWTQENEFTKPLLKGRPPEFPRMSKNPGIGAGAAIKLAESLQEVSNFSEAFFGNSDDVPSLLRTDSRTQPTGRYLKSVMRKTLGWTDPHKAPERALNAWKKEMRTLYETYVEAEKDSPTARCFLKSEHQKKNFLIQENSDAITNIEAKFKKFNLTGAL